MNDTPLPVATDEIIEEIEEIKEVVEEVSEQLASVTVTGPDSNEIVYQLDRPVLVFGREDSCDIVLQDKRCSRKHFVIEMAGEYFDAIDQGSTNKLRIKDKKLLKRRLRDGDVIVIGKYSVLYKGPTDLSSPDELLDAPSVSNPTELPTTSEHGDTVPIPDAPLPSGVVELTPDLDSDGGEDEDGAEGIAPIDLSDIPEEGSEPSEPERVITPAPPEPEAVDDSKTCPKCETDMPENAPCESCGHKSLQLQAQEYFVNHTAKNTSILGGLGLWGLKKGKVKDQVFGIEGVEWVLEVYCDLCGKRHRLPNEFRVKCIRCEHCESEVSLPVQKPPTM